jgi:hypothetical protein
MGAIPILQHGRDVPVCIPNEDLPDFYMTDYSVLGLLVDDLDNAYQVLKDKDFSVCRKPGHLEVNIQGVDQMSEMVNLLTRKGIGCAIADIIDQVYQG